VHLLDSLKGTVEFVFDYVSGNLKTVTFEVYAAEDIRAADGVSDDYYKKDDLVAGHAKFEFLNLDDAVKGISVPFHAGAKKYYEEQGIEVE
jgi:hypothetical protein